MTIGLFHLMPDRFLPDCERPSSMRVDIPHSLDDPVKIDGRFAAAAVDRCRA